MMELKVLVPKADKKAPATVEVSEAVFGINFNEPLIHQVVTAILSGARTGSHKQKTRAEVRGGGAKPWKQKGTGRARAGSIRSPLWRKGGVTFAARPGDYSQKVNKKMYRQAVRSILSELIRQDRLIIVNDITVAEPKTKLLLEQLKKQNLDNVLIVTDNIDINLYLASRNLINVAVIDSTEIDPVSLISFEKVMMTADVVKKLEENLA